MRLYELFADEVIDHDSGDVVADLRNDIMDYLMPLAANGVPYVSMQSVIDKMREHQSGLEIDRALVMQVLDPDQVKLVTKIEGDRLYFKLPIPDERKVEQGQKQKEEDKFHKKAGEQALKAVKSESVKGRPILERSLGTIQSRFSQQGTEVFEIHSLRELMGLMQRSSHHTVRLMLEPNALLAWDAEYATHRNCEEELGADGARLTLTRGAATGLTLEYNINDINEKQLLRHPVIRRLFKPEDLQKISFVSVEI